MKTWFPSRPAPFAVSRGASLHQLFGLALPLVLGGCSGDDDPSANASPRPPGDVVSEPLEADSNGAGEESELPGSSDETDPREQQPSTPTSPASTEEGQFVAGELTPPANEGSDGSTAMNPAEEGDVEAQGGCTGQAWLTADPTSPGPFEVTADRIVGPQAGVVPDRIFGEQQRFNVYRPSDLTTSGLCHPILLWANGTGDNPEQRPPECIVEPATNTWCGTYPGLMNQLASHGFVVLASLSTDTAAGNPVPAITGLDWLLEQAEDPSSPYFQRLDTTRVGALGHSQGGAATSIAAADPRISAMATIHGNRALTGLHGPGLFICGEQDGVVPCDGVANAFRTVTEQPAMFLNNLAADHGSWLGQGGSQGPTFFALTAWFRVHLMDDVDNRRFFFGEDCALCTDNRVTVERNELATAR